MKITLTESFQEKYMPEPNSGCWLWLASCLKDRYGKLSYGVIGRCDGSGRLYLAHRASWIIHNGEIPDGLDVMHSCDNRQCVNPQHLSLGTRADNMADAVAKKRTCGGPRRSLIMKGVFENPEYVANHKAKRPRGEAHGCAKITTADAIAIRNSQEQTSVLARKFSLSKGTIRNIRSGRIWTHI